LGASYIAITRAIDQRLESGSVRSSSETIILVGIDSQRLTPAQTEEVRKWLGGLWVRVDLLLLELNARGISAPITLVNCPELDDWVGDPSVGELPSAPLPVRDSSAPKHGVWSLWRIALSSIALFALVLICGFFWNRTRGPGVVPHPSTPLGPDKSPSNDSDVGLRRLLDDLAVRWGCETSDVAASMGRAMNWDHRTNDPVARVLLDASSNEAVSHRVQALAIDQPDSFTIFMNEADPGTATILRDLLRNQGHRSALAQLPQFRHS
jgi:hypothetical protein